MTFSFTAIGQPLPKQRARVIQKHGRCFAFTPKRTRDYEKHVRWCATQALMDYQRHKGPWRTDLKYDVELTFYRENRRPCDVDNLAKAATDALNGLIWDDDAQIVNVTARKEVDKTKPRAEVIVRVACG